jgi:prevent-host-death family protein
MTEVTIRDLRNRGGEVIDQVATGDHVTITRDGRPVAELSPIRPRSTGLDVLLARVRGLPAVDPAALRRDIDDVLDTSL